ncbi:MAG: hypothetical protein R6V40_02580 [Candidatus Moraniibacteriota bacterium]
MKKQANQKNEKSATVTLLCLVLFFVSFGFFAHSGYEWVQYILSAIFDVETDKDVFDLLSSIIALISSIPIFVGAIFAWNLKFHKTNILIAGAVGFLIKNIIDIISHVFSLTEIAEVTSDDIVKTTGDIGGEFFQIAFWTFVAFLFWKKYKKYKKGLK